MTSNNHSPDIENGIAIVGMACRVPGASNVDEFWANIQSGKESLTQLSDEELLDAGVPDLLMQNPSYVKAGMFLDDVAGFDAEFFGFSPRDARILDPQHRHFLEICWEALEDGGINPYQYEGAMGVFGGSGHNSYMPYNLLSNPELVDDVGFFLLRHTGNDKDFLTTRASYIFNLRGPSVNIQTACSTSLVSVHTAVQSLLNFECDTALAGGISILLPDRHGYLHEEGGITSADGHCRVFDADSTGTIIGSGGGVVLLKRLEDAIRDRDRVHAVVIGSAVNNDGSTKVNYLSPSVDGQAAAISEALEISGVEPDSIGFIECHGTGTAIGDPIEIAALTQAYARENPRLGYCAVGSVKSNIGHTDTAAGVVGLIKAVKSIQSAKIAPTVHFKKPNSEISFSTSPFYVNDKLKDWESNGPRRAAVSSLGVGGTNAHVILEEAPVRDRSDSQPWQILALSAKTTSALESNAARLKKHIEVNRDLNLSECEFTLICGRQAMEQRLVTVVRDSTEAISMLGDLKSESWIRAKSHGTKCGVVFMYAGGGAQYPGMGRDLFEAQPVFREAIEDCARILKKYVDYDLLKLMFPEPERMDEAALEMEKPSRSLPCLFSMQYAQSMLWLSFGVQPEALIGHSMGENTALCVAGGISLDEGLSLVAKRGQLQEKAPEGGMLSIMASPELVNTFLSGELTIGVINGPEMCVVSGSPSELSKLEEQLNSEDIPNARVRINVAAHSPMLDPILPEFKAHLETFDFKKTTIPIASTFSGTWLTEEQARSAEYWTDQLRNPVKFSDAIRLLLTSDDNRVFLEVGPANTLTSLAMQQPESKGRSLFSSSRRRKDVDDDNIFMLKALGSLWAADVDLDWARFYRDKRVGRIGLPTYSFEHKEHWVEPGDIRAAPVGKRGDRNLPDDWFYQPTWRTVTGPADLSESPTETGVLILGEHNLVSIGLKDRIEGAGYPCEATENFSNAELLRATLSELATKYPRGLVVLLVADETPPELNHSGLEKTLLRLSTLAVAMAEVDVPAMRLSVVSAKSLQCVIGEQISSVISSSMHGMLRVLPKEIPALTTRYIDTDIDDSTPKNIREITLDLVAAEALANFDLEVAQSLRVTQPDYSRFGLWCYRQGQRLGEEFTKISRGSLGDPSDLELSDKHIVITGGLGGLGLAAAKNLAKHGCSNISLIGRSELPDRREWHAHRTNDSRLAGQVIVIEELESAGVNINLLTADVTDGKSLRAALDLACEQSGPINGVIHAAGTLDDRFLQLKTRYDVEAVVGPKILGAINLVEAVRGEPLDFVIFYSSISSYLGLQGQSDYAAANAFLDSYARDLKSQGVPAISINWSIWRDIGMAADLASGRKSAGTGFAAFAPRTRDNVYEVCIGTNDWMLNEHRTRDGLAVVPGTGLIQLAYSAVQSKSDILKHESLRIEDLALFTPISVPDGDQIISAVRFSKGQSALEFEILSANNPWSAETDEWRGEHAQGRMSSQIPDPQPRIDISNIKSRMREDKNVADAGLPSTFMSFGPRWNCLNEYWLGEQEILAELELPQDFVSDLEQFSLHPALFDNAVAGLQSIHHHRSNPDEFLIPMSYGEISIYKRLPRTIVSHLRMTGSDEADRRNFDVDIYDVSGELLVSVRAFSMKIGKRDMLDQQPKDADIPTNKMDFSGGITPKEGGEVLEVLMCNPLYSQVLVSPNDFDAVFAEAQTRKEVVADGEGIEHNRQVSADYVAPENSLQQKIAFIWQNGLGIEHIGIHDNFFNLGGHSLLLTQLASRMKKELSVSPKISLLFDKPTIYEWARLAEVSTSPSNDGPTTGGGLKRLSRERFISSETQFK